jgi:hypothetical protein
MALTRTSFRPGHAGRGGRPKGVKNGAGRNAWRVAWKRVTELARQIDVLQAKLLSCSDLSPDQRVRFAEIVRIRRTRYETRSKYRRPIRKTGGARFVFGHLYGFGQIYDRVNKKWIKYEPKHLSLRARKPVSRLDRGAQTALRKFTFLDRLERRLLGELATSPSDVTRPSREASSKLRALHALVKAEAALLDRSRDPRPIPVDTPILIHLGIPLDLLDPDSDEPSPLLYGARPSDLWTQTEITSYRERRKHFYAELGVTEAQVHVNRRTRDERRGGGADMRPAQSKTQTKGGSPTARRSSKQCPDCRGTGHSATRRTCPDCLGAEYFDKDHPPAVDAAGPATFSSPARVGSVAVRAVFLSQVTMILWGRAALFRP